MESLLSMQLVTGKKTHLSNFDVLRIMKKIHAIIKMSKVHNKVEKIYKSIKRIIVPLLLIFVFYIIIAITVYQMWGFFKEHKWIYWPVAIIACLLICAITDLKILAYMLEGARTDASVFTVSFDTKFYAIEFMRTEVKMSCLVITETPSKFLVIGAGAIRKKDLSESNVKQIQEIVRNAKNEIG